MTRGPAEGYPGNQALESLQERAWYRATRNAMVAYADYESTTPISEYSAEKSASLFRRVEELAPWQTTY